MSSARIFLTGVVIGLVSLVPDSSHAGIIEQFNVNSAQATPTYSTNVLTSGQQYLIEVSGFYRFNDIGFPNRQADAEYLSDFAFASGILNNPQGGLDLLVVSDGLNIGTEHFNAAQNLSAWDINWGAFNPSHEYSTVLTGNGQTIGFVISDTWQTGPAFGENAGVFDNTGSLSVTISRIDDPQTVPEPASIALWCVLLACFGAIGLGIRLRRGSRLEIGLE